VRAALSAVRDEPGRTAMCISLILFGAKHAESRLPTVLLELRRLEDQCQVTSTTDEQGVMRWQTCTPESGTHGQVLGAQVFDTGEYRLSPSQIDALGL